jgi:NarL family two-component system response regulator LiaR
MGIRILLATDHLVVREGLRILLEQEGFVVVAEAADGVEALELAHTVEFDVAVLDMSMSRMNGLDIAREILSFLPASAIVLLTVHQDEPHIAAAIGAGIRGYVTKTESMNVLSQAIREVAFGKRFYSPPAATALLSKSRT